MDYQGKINCDHRIGNPIVGYLQKDCPRCLGVGEYGGVDIQSDITTISGYFQIEQSVKKILIEKKRNTGYGFDYSLLRAVIDVDTLPIIKKEIIRCVNYLKSIQKLEQARGSAYDPRELLDSIKYLNVIQSDIDPRQINVSLIISTEAGTNNSVSLTLQR